MSEETRGKLAGTPYERVKDWNKFSDAAFKDMWQEAERAIIFWEKILPHPFMQPYRNKLTTPMRVTINKSSTALVSFWTDENGVPVAEIGEEFLRLSGDNSNVGDVIKAMFSVYTEHYRKLLQFPDTSFASYKAKAATEVKDD